MNNVNPYKLPNSNIAFRRKSTEIQKMTDEEKILKAISNCAKRMQENCEKSVPENGKYNTSVGIEYPMENGNTFAFDVVHDGKKPQNQRRIKLSVRRTNRDVNYENYIFTGTKKEVIEYFANIDVNAIYDDIMRLSSKVDLLYSQ